MYYITHIHVFFQYAFTHFFNIKHSYFTHFKSFMITFYTFLFFQTCKSHIFQRRSSVLFSFRNVLPYGRYQSILHLLYYTPYIPQDLLPKLFLHYGYELQLPPDTAKRQQMKFSKALQTFSGGVQIFFCFLYPWFEVFQALFYSIHPKTSFSGVLRQFSCFSYLHLGVFQAISFFLHPSYFFFICFSGP